MHILSICVATRNRQDTASITLSSLVENLPRDVEVIVADNSDDHAEIYKLVAPEVLNHSQVKLLPSESKALSMRQNWERALNASNGEWVTFIGDDDFVDPKISYLLRRIQKSSKKEVEYVGWNHLLFEWPEARRFPTNIQVCLANELHDWPLLKAKAHFMECVGKRPPALLTPYHGAMRRSLIDKVRNLITKDGVFFKHSNTDYFTGWLAGAVAGVSGIFCARPLSVAGVCKKSNSHHVRKNFLTSVNNFFSDAKTDTYPTESGIEINRGFPQSLTEGFDHMFLDFVRFTGKHSDYQGNWKQNLKTRAELELAEIVDEEEFRDRHESLSEFVSKRTGLEINVSLQPMVKKEQLARGLVGDQLFMDNDAFGSTTPAQLYNTICCFLRPVEQLGSNVKVLRRG